MLHNVVPARFPLARKAMERVEKARQREVERFARERNLRTIDITDKDIVGSFSDIAWQGRKWKDAVHAVGREYSLTDDLGRPLDRHASRVVRLGEKAFRRARREYLEDQKIQARFEASQAASSDRTD